MPSIAPQIAIAAAGAYLAVLWIGMGVLQRRVRSGLTSGRLVTAYDSYKEEPDVVQVRAKVAMYSVCVASFALGAYLYLGDREPISVYVSVACMIFFGGSYAVYAAWPNKPRFLKRLRVRDSTRPGSESFDAPGMASTKAHAAAAVAGTAAAVGSAYALLAQGGGRSSPSS